MKVQAFLEEGHYLANGMLSDPDLETLELERHPACPNWPQVIRPRIGVRSKAQAEPTTRELMSGRLLIIRAIRAVAYRANCDYGASKT